MLLAIIASVLFLAAGADVRYIVTIDAGSSGSRVHIHRYTLRPGGEVPYFNPVSDTLKLKPGLSSFQDSPSEAGSSIEGLLQFAERSVPQAVWQSTPVYLKATAGLRAIPKDKSDAILQSCIHTLSASSFSFDPERGARIITGTEEGIFGWLAVNYLHGSLNGISGQDTVGLVEMGGASMQVSFVPENPESVPRDQIQTVAIGNKKYKLFTHSFMNYGLEKAQEKLIEMHKTSASVVSPCYPKGATFEGITGTGNYAKCQLHVDKVLRLDQCPVQHANPFESVCSLDGIRLPRFAPQKRFFAVENFFFTSEFFGTIDGDAPVAGLLESGRKFCSMDWAHIVKTFATERDPEHELTKYCFSSVYIPKILQEAFDLKESSVQIAKKIDSADIDWALGSVIHDVEAHNLKHCLDDACVSDSSLEALDLLLALLGIGLLFFLYRRSLPTKKTYDFGVK